jgi:hypothetical protein
MASVSRKKKKGDSLNAARSRASQDTNVLSEVIRPAPPSPPPKNHA